MVLIRNIFKDSTHFRNPYHLEIFYDKTACSYSQLVLQPSFLGQEFSLYFFVILVELKLVLDLKNPLDLLNSFSNELRVQGTSS